MRNIIILLLITTFSVSNLLSQTEKNSFSVNGKVLDASTKQPIEGLSVISPDYSATFSFTDGSFSIEVPNKESMILVEGLDYNSMNIPVKGRDSIVVYAYKGKHKSFNDNYNNYYYSKPQIFNTSALSVYEKGGEEWKSLSTTADSYFDDEIAGLNVINKSGMPASGSNILLHGYNSLYCTNQPLIVIDGFIFDIKQFGDDVINGYRTNPLSFIDENDIQSVTVVKDATSLYGAMGANGVIFINTDHAKQMATKINLSFSGGINFAPENLPVLDADQYRSFLSDIEQSNSAITGEQLAAMPYFNDDVSYVDYYRYHNNTNWQDEIFKNSYSKNVKFKISGGDEIALYMVSIGYQDIKGIERNTGSSRYNLRFNSDININKKLFVASNISMSYNASDLKDEGIMPESNPVLLSRIKAPILYPYIKDENGNVSPNLEDVDIFGIGNPVAAVKNVNATSRNYRIMAFTDIQYKVNSDFEISDLIGINYDKIRDEIFRPDLGLPSTNLIIDSSTNNSSQNVNKLYSIKNDFRIKYNKSINNSWFINGLGGVRSIINTADYYWSQDYNSPSDEYPNLGNGDINLAKGDGNSYEWNSLSLYANADVDYLHKYILSLGLSLYGSSKFGDDAEGISMLSGKFGTFPYISGAWIISSEDFMNDLNFIDLFKIRASYGITGNDDIGFYSYDKLYATQSFMNSSGVVISNLANQGIQWEVVKKQNMGTDIALFHERLNLSFDLFMNRTEGLYNYIKPASNSSGFNYYIDNDGVMETNGMDFTVNGRIVNTQIKWDLGLIYSKYKTTIVEYPNDEEIKDIVNGYVLIRKDNPIQFYGYKSLGVIYTEEEAALLNLKEPFGKPFEAGDIHFWDKDGNNIINENDRTIIGDPNPDFIGTVTSRISWKGLSLDAAISFCYGNDVYNYQRYILESMKSPYNQLESVVNRWKNDGQVTDMPKATFDDPMGNSRFSDRWIEDGSYIKIKSVTLSYNLPMQYEMLQGIEVFVSAYNLYTFTKYKGLDPEFSLSNSVFDQGIDVGLIPQPKSIYMGIRFAL